MNRDIYTHIRSEIMKYISDTDREFIENKYHKKNEPFDPTERFAYHGHECDPTTGLDDVEMREGLERIYSENLNKSHALIKAMGFAYVLDNARIDTPSEDYFYAFYNWGRPTHKPITKKWYDAVFDSMPDVKQIRADYTASATSELWLDTDHVVPYWVDILGLGFSGLLSRSERYRSEKVSPTPEEDAFFESIKIEYEAILRLLNRIADYADAHRGEKSELLSKSLRNIAKNPPSNTLEALLTIYTYHLCAESVDLYQVRSLGNGLDRSLYAYYKRDLESGRFTRDEIKGFLAYFMMQFSSMGNFWGQPFYLCGTDFDEKTDISELTLDILEVYDSLNIYNPKIQIKIDQKTNPRIIYRALEMIRAGHTSIIFCCIPGITKSLMSCYGATEEEARNCDISGCNEMHVRGKESCMISALANAAKAISYVFNNGLDTVTGKRLGAETGDVESFSTFDEFYEAYITQFKYMLDTILDTARRYEKYVSEIEPSIMLSATVEDALKKAKDAYGYGFKYTNSCILLCSFATAVDSLLAVKELVFEKKVTTLTELKAALLANWEGYEELRRKALTADKKYGNADPEADLYATALFRWFSAYVTGQKNSRGGVYKVGVPSTLHYIKQGKISEATPDGRRQGEEFSKNSQPVVGTERNGITAMMRSAMACQPWLFSEAFVLDMMLHPSVMAGEDGLKAVKGLIDTYMKNDGLSIQFNIFSSDMLRDAQAHPEKYENLQVRLTGWNVLWNNISKKDQEAYIKRCEALER